MSFEKIVDAAKALARIANEKQKHVIFNMHTYMELTVAVGRNTRADSLFDSMEEWTEEDKALIRATIEEQKVLRDKRKEFVDQLADAFTTNEVCEIASCALVEIGGTDEFPTLGEAMVYMIVLIPKEEDCFVLDL
jgi:lipopolysaccharide biosynthesis regulator YciM